MLRIYVVFFFVTIVGFSILAKALHVQLIEGDKWRSINRENTIYQKNIEPERGNVYARDGRLLATSIPIFDLHIDFASPAMTQYMFNTYVDALAQKMARHIGRYSSYEWKKRMIRARKKRNRYFLVKRGLSYSELIAIKKWPFFNLGRYKAGLVIEQRHIRKHPFGSLAKRTIGKVMQTQSNRPYGYGIERTYNRHLAGEEGHMVVQKIAGGIFIPIHHNEVVHASPGLDLYTTIDVELQDVAHNALEKTLIKHKADHGSIVLMDVQTGAIRAISNLKRNQNNVCTEYYNYAVGERTEPGSTIKLASVIALLEDGYADTSTRINIGRGRYKYYDRWMNDHDRGRSKDSVITLARAFEKSSNVGISKLVNNSYSKHKRKFFNHFVRMGLLDSTGIEIKGEPMPKVNDPLYWSGVSLPWMSIGYETEFTPLQLLTFYNAIANGGKMVKPYLVEAIKSYGEEKQHTKIKTLKNKICSFSTIQKVQDILESVVEKGTAQNLKNANYKIAGKTGTALISNKKTSYRDRVYQASFIGYFPADKPRYSCAVVINGPTGVHYGGAGVAGPAFREVADKVYASSVDWLKPINLDMDIPIKHIPVIQTNHRQDVYQLFQFLGASTADIPQTSKVKVINQADKLAIRPYKTKDNRMPYVTGLSLQDALFELEDRGLIVSVVGRGMVSKQSIPKGSLVQKGDKILLTLD